MENLRISIQKDEEYIYFLVNRILVSQGMDEMDLIDIEEGDELEIEIPSITRFILEELEYLDELEEIAIGHRYIAVRRSNFFPCKEMVPAVKKVIRRCFNIEELISKI